MVLTTFRAAPGTDRVLRASDAQLEALTSALNSHQAADRDDERAPTTTSGLRLLMAQRHLEDAAIACGMSIDEPNLEEWAAEAVADFLRRA